ncbi:fasciclin domain-containing protein [Roseisolibacter sp. H3M3-2]|uniref:fasciclin domain-containing protein n=1 Tax=Roseisolibacter sp. H3M3-2 TaxID=3031323 RepID=UPI0023D99507|nr:fasciclin domain-containing protein [Roseisolibacter sp. H3M3-2]MDF1504963.1 fasciclin domain-containing protein [Roseisolibacter sp. H3M3-2]
MRLSRSRPLATLIGQLGAETVLSCAVLPNVLSFHVARGRHTSTSVLARPTLPMVNGESAAIVGTTTAGAPLDLGLIDVAAGNGIVHVVDAVLLPPSLDR